MKRQNLQTPCLWASALLAVLTLLGCSSQVAAPAAQQMPWSPRYVVLLSIDTCRADHLGAYGYRRSTTPSLDALAREGVLFEQAHSQSNESLYSYASVFTGLYPASQGALHPTTYHLQPQAETLAGVLRARGFKTAGFVGGAHLSASLGFASGFDVYQDQPDFGTFHGTVPPALAWLSACVAARSPAFLFVQGYDVHVPYGKPLGYSRLFAGVPAPALRTLLEAPHEADIVYQGVHYPMVEVSRAMQGAAARGEDISDPAAFVPHLAEQGGLGYSLTEADRDVVIGQYDGALAYADAWVGYLRARIQALGIAEQTLLVVMGDHGEDLLDHGYVGHRTSLHDATLHVPLIVWAPGLGVGGRRVPELVELRSLRSTICEIVDGKPETRDPQLGASLRPCLDGHADACEHAAVVAQGVRGGATIRTSKHRLVVGSVGGQLAPEQLYDLRADPREQRALRAPGASRAGTRSQDARWRGKEAAVCGALRSELQRRLAAGVKQEAAGQGRTESSRDVQRR